MRNEFMAAWDGLSSKDNQRILILSATNRPFVLDDAVIRRLLRRIYMDLPDTENRMKDLKVGVYLVQPNMRVGVYLVQPNMRVKALVRVPKLANACFLESLLFFLLTGSGYLFERFDLPGYYIRMLAGCDKGAVCL